MNYKNLVTSAVRQWNFTRSETSEILNSLDDEQLQFKPEGEKWKTLFEQFSCIYLTQVVYSRSIKEGRMKYRWFHDQEASEMTKLSTKEELIKALQKADKKWIEAIREKREDEEFKVKWPGFNQNLLNTMSSLIAHERLHHGQLIAYFTLAGFELPKNFKENWSL